MNPNQAPVKQVATPQINISPIEQEKLQKAYQKASTNKPILDQLLQKVGQQSGARVITNYKNPQTTENKIDEKNQEDPNRNYDVKDVNDIARGRLVYNSLDALRKGSGTLKDAIKQSPAAIAKIEDFFKKPEDGYHGYHVDVAFPNGQHSEIQLHTPQSFAAAMATHGIHEQFGDQPPDQVAQKARQVNDQIMKLPDVAANAVSTIKELQNAPVMAKAQQSAAQMAQGVPQTPQQSEQGLGNNMMQPAPQQSPAVVSQPGQTPPYQAAFPPSQGGQGMQGMGGQGIMNNAISLLRGRIQPSDIDTIGQFSEKVERGKDKGNMGTLGQEMQSLASNVFGDIANNWTNKQIKNAFDLIVERTMKGKYG